jgi:glutamate-1-semialdehyde 2,1-aminomutase
MTTYDDRAMTDNHRQFFRESSAVSRKSVNLAELETVWRTEFAEKHKKSASADGRAAEFIAAGQRARFSSGMLFPIYIGSGEGAWFADIDGNRFLDCNAGWNASLFGRGNPYIAEAVARAAQRLGAPGGAMHPSLVRDDFAAKLCARVPGAERVIFAPSGSEANTYALRLARSITGQELIMRVSGGFHGQNEYLLQGESSLKGLPFAVTYDHVDIQYNDVMSAQRALEQYSKKLVAVIVEPIMTIPGAVHQRNQFVQELRSLALEYRVPFILDEVIAGGRFSAGGASAYLGLTPPPDLTVLGKMLGGGLPVAAVVGSAEYVEQPISASNTHAQNPVTLAAALANLELSTDEVFARVRQQGAAIRAGIRDIAADVSLDIQVTGDGPCCGVHFTSEDVVNARVASEADQRLWRLMCLGVTNGGLAISSRTFGPIAPYADDDVRLVIDVFRDVLMMMDQAVQNGVGGSPCSAVAQVP